MARKRVPVSRHATWVEAFDAKQQRLRHEPEALFQIRKQQSFFLLVRRFGAAPAEAPEAAEA